jgi:hypothetical protein
MLEREEGSQKPNQQIILYVETSVITINNDAFFLLGIYTLLGTLYFLTIATIAIAVYNSCLKGSEHPLQAVNEPHLLLLMGL